MHFRTFAGHADNGNLFPQRSASLISRHIPIVSLALVYSASSHAELFKRLLDIALSSEPTYQGAKANLQASQAFKSQAVGAFLPQVTSNASTNFNHRQYETRSSLIQLEKDQFQ